MNREYRPIPLPPKFKIGKLEAVFWLLLIVGTFLLALAIVGCNTQDQVTGGTGKLSLTLDPQTKDVIGLTLETNRDTRIDKLEVPLPGGKRVLLQGYVGNGSKLGIQGQLPLGIQQSNERIQKTYYIVNGLGEIVGMMPFPGMGQFSQIQALPLPESPVAAKRPRKTTTAPVTP